LLELLEERPLRRIVHSGPAYDGQVRCQTPNMA
jgi:hypothetical protein